MYICIERERERERERETERERERERERQRERERERERARERERGLREGLRRGREGHEGGGSSEAAQAFLCISDYSKLVFGYASYAYEEHITA